MNKKLPVPTEEEEQETLFMWAESKTGKFPELELLYHITNEGKRNPITGARLRAQGLKKGFPDICLPVARGGKHALYIEMKRTEGGKVGAEQEKWLRALAAEGNAAYVCFGWIEAAEVIEDYLIK